MVGLCHPIIPLSAFLRTDVLSPLVAAIILAVVQSSVKIFKHSSLETCADCGGQPANGVLFDLSISGFHLFDWQILIVIDSISLSLHEEALTIRAKQKKRRRERQQRTKETEIGRRGRLVGGLVWRRLSEEE